MYSEQRRSTADTSFRSTRSDDPVTGDRLGSREIRSLRPAKPEVRLDRPIGHRWDIERGLGARARHALTVFLAGAECPFTCVFCDLWKHTTSGATPVGALPRQLEIALAEASGGGPSGAGHAIKLYNASNFFDNRSVPPEDDDALARLCAPFERVTVETHARLLGDRAEAFATSLDGRFEIAMGLETIHPTVFPRLNKGMTLSDFDRAVGWARDRGIGVRAFVLVGLPWTRPSEYATWAGRSVDHAAGLGVDRVSLIPLRTGNGALEALAERGDLGPVRLDHVEDALERCLAAVGGRMIVEVDVWDLADLARCDRCAAPRIDRLARANLEQEMLPPPECDCAF